MVLIWRVPLVRLAVQNVTRKEGEVPHSTQKQPDA
jgi:hypothetical protein